jgi:hypothetical protein
MMRRSGGQIDWKLYFEALPLYARNLGVLLYPLIAAGIGLGITYLGNWFSAPTGFALMSLFGFIIELIEFFACAVAIIFADDAWRHGRGNLRNAWEQARRRAGDIVIVSIGLIFIINIAGLIGSIGGFYVAMALRALAVWAFVYALPAVSIGGIPAGGAFNSSVQAARRHPLATAILAAIVIILIPIPPLAPLWYGLPEYLLGLIGGYLSAGYDVAQVLLSALALGYIALVTARQYADLAFRGFL